MARVREKYHETEGCWIWNGAINSKGYGVYSRQYAHRLSWELNRGKIPKDMFVCHKCDNPRCIRPDHLFLGTNQDNIADMVAKGRNAVGSKIGCSVHTEEEVLEIRKKRISGLTYPKIAAMHGYSELECKHGGRGWKNIRAICKNETWKHVNLGPESASITVDDLKFAKISITDADEIRRLRESGVSGIEVAQMYGISVQYVCSIFKDRARKSVTGATTEKIN